MGMVTPAFYFEIEVVIWWIFSAQSLNEILLPVQFQWLCNQSMEIFATLLSGNTLSMFMTTHPFPWQQLSATKVPFHFQFLLIIYKTKLVTYHFYYFFGKALALVNYSNNITKSYSVENWICQKWSKSKYRISHLIIFPQTSVTV